MTSRDFCFWLQGFFELQGPQNLDSSQLRMVRAHLALVFKHEIDPSMGDDKHQGELNSIHDFDLPTIPPSNDVVFRC